MYNSPEILKQILNFSNKVSDSSESQDLLYIQRKSTFKLSCVFGICCHCRNLMYFYKKVCIAKKHRWYKKPLTLQLSL